MLVVIVGRVRLEMCLTSYVPRPETLIILSSLPTKAEPQITLTSLPTMGRISGRVIASV